MKNGATKNNAAAMSVEGNTGCGNGMKASNFVKPLSVKLVSHHRDTIGCHMEEEFYNPQGRGEEQQEEGEQFDESEIFNDMLEGGGVAPSNNNDDTLRDSIKYSFVSSEQNLDIGGGLGGTNSNSANRDFYVMNRMNWITYLKVLFDELESFTQATSKQKHVEQGNFLKALKKIKTMLPLQTKTEYNKTCGEVCFSYRDVEGGLSGNFGVYPSTRYITWDNVIDMFLSRQTPSILQTSQTSYAASQQQYNQQITLQNNFPQTTFQASATYQSTKNNAQVIMTEESQTSNDLNIQQQNYQQIQFKKQMSFSDNLPAAGKMQVTSVVQKGQNSDSDENEGVASPMSSSGSSGGESLREEKKISKAKLEESVRSSRTANFIPSMQQPGVFNQSNVYAPSTLNTQTSYYEGGAAALNSSMNSKKVQMAQQTAFVENPILSYYKNASTAASAIMNQEEEIKEDQNRSSSRRGYIEQDHIVEEQSPSQYPHNEYDSFNKKSNNQSVHKGSVASLQSINQSQTLTIDHLDYSNRGLKIYEGDIKQKKPKSINLAFNDIRNLSRPSHLQSSLLFLNVSHNKLSTLDGVESLGSLKVLNASHNLITSAMQLTRLKSLREVILGNNCISLLNQIADIKNLEILDVSFNKLLEIEKLLPIKNLHKLRVLCIEGNMMQKRFTHYEKLIRDMLGASIILDPECIRDYSQFEDMAYVCYPIEEPPAALLKQISAPIPQPVQTFPKERSITPTKLRKELILTVKAPNTINLKAMKSPPRTMKNQVTITRAFEFGASKQFNVQKVSPRFSTQMTSSFEIEDKLIVKKTKAIAKASTSRSITRDKSLNSKLQQQKQPSSTLNIVKTVVDDKRLLTNHTSMGFGTKSQQLIDITSVNNSLQKQQKTKATAIQVKSERPITSMKSMKTQFSSTASLPFQFQTQGGPQQQQQTSKNPKISTSFVFESKQNDSLQISSNRSPLRYNGGRMTPNQQFKQIQSTIQAGAPNQQSQFQRFISSSKNASRKTSQTPSTSNLHNVSRDLMNSRHQIHQNSITSLSNSQTNLPPRVSYQNPGEKKLKSEGIPVMVHSLINNTKSQLMPKTLLNEEPISSSEQTVKNQIYLSHSPLINEEHSPQFQGERETDKVYQYYKVSEFRHYGGGGSSGGSMSPVLDEINAQKKKRK